MWDGRVRRETAGKSLACVCTIRQQWDWDPAWGSWTSTRVWGHPLLLLQSRNAKGSRHPWPLLPPPPLPEGPCRPWSSWKVWGREAGLLGLGYSITCSLIYFKLCILGPLTIFVVV